MENPSWNIGVKALDESCGNSGRYSEGGKAWNNLGLAKWGKEEAGVQIGWYRKISWKRWYLGRPQRIKSKTCEEVRGWSVRQREKCAKALQWKSLVYLKLARSQLSRGVVTEGEEGRGMVGQGLVGHYKDSRFEWLEERPLEGVKLGSDMVWCF